MTNTGSWLIQTTIKHLDHVVSGGHAAMYRITESRHLIL